MMPKSNHLNPFFRTVFATATGLALFVGVLVIVVGFVLNYFANDEHPKDIEAGSVLQLKFDDEITEQGNEQPELAEALFEKLFGKKDEHNIHQIPPGLLGIAAAVRKAAVDPNIIGLSVQFESYQAGQAQLKELQNALIAFKKSGKFLYGHAEGLREIDHYMASVLDIMMVYPHATVEFDGFSAKFSLFKGALELLGLKPKIFRVGKYKSATEPFTRTKLSAENRHQYQILLDGMYGQYLQDIAAAKDTTSHALRQLATKLSILHAKDALKHGFVTHLGYKSTYEALLREKLSLKKTEKLPLVPLKRYKKALFQGQKSQNTVAVIIAEGTIQNTSDPDVAGISPRKIIPLLTRAEKDKNVKAIVLRINSPGGSFIGSDKIWHEIQRIAEKKPVIASLSNLAASGGYYLAMACDTIVAYPNTLTGSIGVFSMLLESEGLLKKLGITTDQVQTAPFADIRRPRTQLTPTQERVHQADVERIYQVFLDKASKSRALALDTMESLAQGRVWTGSTASTHGLIDTVGYFQDALIIAAKAAHIAEKKYQVQYMYPSTALTGVALLEQLQLGWLTKLINLMQLVTESTKMSGLRQQIFPISETDLQEWILLRAPVEMEIH